MAKMFYSLDEAAERLSVTPDRVKEMVAAGQLQQFRDRNQLMFKRDQIDAMAEGGGDRANLDDSGSPIDLADSSAGTKMGSSGPISLADSGDTDAISLSDDTAAGRTATGATGAGGTGTGISVFDADEVDAADPMAQTQVTRAHAQDEEIALEAVGSGSGLLDLTRESDDTSLGAELLDEIYPGGESGDSRLESAVGSSGVFESALGTEVGGATGSHAPSGLTNLGQPASASGMGPAIDTGPLVGGVGYSGEEPIDPAWSGASAGMLLAATLGLIVGLIAIAGGIGGNTGGLARTLSTLAATPATSSLMLLGGLLLLAIILGGVGFALGRSAR